MRNEFLRHTISTINYRFQKSIANVDNDFGYFSAGKESRTPNEIINHMFHVLNATCFIILEEKYNKEEPKRLELKSEIDRFNMILKKLDKVFIENEIEINYTKRLLQGPLSDILTHIGQISMLSRLNGAPIEGEDFASATIVTGIV